MGAGTEIKNQLDQLTQSSNQISHLENYSEISLDESEIEEALRKGREEKHYRLKRESYNEQIRSERVPLKFTAEKIFESFRTFWTIDNHNEEIITNLCFYFTEDSR